MKGLILTLPGTVNNNNLPVLNRISFAAIANGNKSGISTLQITTLDSEDNVILTLSSAKGAFYTDVTGTQIIGTSTVLGKNILNTIYLKLSGDDELLIDNAQCITGFGYGVTNPSMSPFILAFSSTGNSPTFAIDTDIFKYLVNLEHIDFSKGVQLSGDMSSLYYTASLRTAIDCFSAGSLNNLVANMADDWVQIWRGYGTVIPTVANSIDLAYIHRTNSPDGIVFEFENNTLLTSTYTGGRAKDWGPINVFFVASPLKANEVDDLLISMASTATAVNVKKIVVSGARTTASDSAIATLQSKGFTVSAPSV